MAVLDDVCVFGSVEGGDRPSVVPHPHVEVGRVDGHGQDVDAQVGHKQDAGALSGS